MAKRKTDEPQWSDKLTSESLESMSLEPVTNADGELSGYKLVWASESERDKSTEVNFATPYLHVSGGDVYMFGKVFKTSDRDQRFKRWFTVKTTEGFDKVDPSDWPASHAKIIEDNQKYYAAVEALHARIAVLVYELPMVRRRFLLAVIDANKPEVVRLFGDASMLDKALRRSFLKKKDALIACAKDLEINPKTEKKWKEMAAISLAKKAAARIVGTDLSREDAALRDNIAVELARRDAKMLVLGKKKFDEVFQSWIFEGKSADETESGEEMKADDPLHKTHRYKMRPFMKLRDATKKAPRKGGLRHRDATQVKVNSNLLKQIKYNEETIFDLEEEARQEGYTTTPIEYEFGNGKAPRGPMHTLPNGNKVPWYQDPRTYFLRPGSVVKLVASFFIYVLDNGAGRIGVRMGFDKYVRMWKRGPITGRKAVPMDEGEGSDIEEEQDGDNDGDDGDAEELVAQRSKKSRTGYIDASDDENMWGEK